MPGYHPQDIEKKWQAHWKDQQTFKADNASDKPKYYVLDMFPYPSGAGLHVGHPLGYIASDIVSRYKRLRGFNVLHPMGFDSFGLPAEQYAIQTGQHPALTTEQNIDTYIRQLNSLGFSYDWSREVRTSDPAYYKWTQWIFLKLFNSWYNLDTNKAEPLKTLLEKFEQNGSEGIRAAGDDEERHSFTAGQWKLFSEKQRLEVVHPYRLAYQQDTYVNWCPGLGTVLSNDEVKDGLSERGGFPVERRLMPQWNLRITAYADRLLQGLDTLDWPDAVKEMQRNWIGKSIGAEVTFQVQDHEQAQIKVYTTRVDTIYGATFLVLAPEHELVKELTTPGQQAEIQDYIDATKRRSERDRMADTKTVTGAFTGAYALNPLSNEPIQIWIADYVLAGYGTGAVMAVPSGDQRDYVFAKNFDLPIVQVVDAQQIDEQADPTKDGLYLHGLIKGQNYKQATQTLIGELEQRGIGKGKTNFRIRDAIFGRQRYWGEPIPIYYKEGTAYGVAEADLPLVLPEIDEYKPTETGEPPLGRAKDWKYKGLYEYELSTMPGWAGSSWYYLRYMDPQNTGRFVGEEAEQYWQQVDLYMGGAEHATGHLLYSRFWHLFLKDLGVVSAPEPFQKLINQGMILGVSEKIRRSGYKTTAGDEGEGASNSAFIITKKGSRQLLNNDVFSVYLSADVYSEKYADSKLPQYIETHVPIDLTRNSEMDVENILSYLKNKREESSAVFVCENGFHVFHYDKSSETYIYKGFDEILDIEHVEHSRSGLGEIKNPASHPAPFKTRPEVEKMSKSKYNVVNPDVLIDKYGADALRLYEMFLGPLEQFKPWNTNGMSGVAGFLKKLWRLYHPQDGTFAVTDEAATPQELKALHKAIRKVEEDIEKFSFNTTVSALMITVNELTALDCHKRAILEPLVLLLSPYAPHLAEELWQQLGHPAGSISHTQYPEFREEYLVEDTVNYPVAINGKVRETLQFPATATPADIEAAVRASDFLPRFADGKEPKKFIVVPGRMVNVVV
ncbi:leucine--tRNA ligase [Hymenobacter canadensis]|uniref:Leucine--tRNA ligase n=1 Tax=Hymenobacter canadensis TaxID=2999067 RepID=A0ABY7LUF5_9BACT|nr:class I tRNA ligase family protein [Hymenobacter canadensis]WBA43239.1 class I tRNA ligase family protein [Hymenobacter canadensis]